MAESPSKSFAIVHGVLRRSVEPRRGRPYVQHCTLDAFTAVAAFIAERGDQGVTTNELWTALPDVPDTQASIALDFLKERCCITTYRKRNYPASTFVFEDALLEWHALAHQAQEADR